MDEQTARRLLAAAVRERDATRDQAEQSRRQLYDVIRQVAPVLKQVEIAAETKWTREHVRQIVEGNQK